MNWPSVIVLLFLACGGSRAAELPRAATAERTGLEIGSKAPLFTLNDQAGQAVALEALLARGPVAIVFHRSADW